MDMTTTKSSPGFFRRSLDAFIAARERQARLHVSRSLSRFSDSELEALGYDRADLVRRRAD
jgi:hypothetical protein